MAFPLFKTVPAKVKIKKKKGVRCHSFPVVPSHHRVAAVWSTSLALRSLVLKTLTWSGMAQGGETLHAAGLKIKGMFHAVLKGFLFPSWRL